MSGTAPSATGGWTTLPRPRVVRGCDQRVMPRRERTYMEQLEIDLEATGRELEDAERRNVLLRQQVAALEAQLAERDQGLSRYALELQATRRESEQAVSYVRAIQRVQRTGSAHGDACRRARAAGNLERLEIAPGVLFEPDAWRLGTPGQWVNLTPNEGMLLRALVEQRGRTVQVMDLIAAVWQGESVYQDMVHGLNVLRCRLRKKLLAAGVAHLLVTIGGIGYRFEVLS